MPRLQLGGPFFVRPVHKLSDDVFAAPTFEDVESMIVCFEVENTMTLRANRNIVGFELCRANGVLKFKSLNDVGFESLELSSTEWFDAVLCFGQFLNNVLTENDLIWRRGSAKTASEIYRTPNRRVAFEIFVASNL